MTRYRTWVRSLLAPRQRLLPGIGARLSGHPRLVASILSALGRLPSERLRAASERNLARPLLERLDTKVDIRVRPGFRMIVRTSEPMGRVLAASGSWEPHVSAALGAFLSDGDVCVDVGANIGYDALFAMKLVGQAGRVYALEPSPATHRELVRNLELNQASNVVALQIAAADADGEVVLWDHPEGQSVRSAVSMPGNLSQSPQTAAVRVPAQTLASLVPGDELRRLRLVKIDVEGFEVEVLRGLAPVYLQGAQPAVLVELHRGAVEQAVALLRDLGARHALRLFKLVNDNDPPRRHAGGELPPWVEREIKEGDLVPNGSHVLLSPLLPV